MPLVIPQDNIPPSQIDPKLTILYGPPKVGKTEQFNQDDSPHVPSKLPGVLILDTEKGCGYINARKLPINSWEEFCEAHLLLKAKREKFLAVDTIDKLEEFCERNATANYRNSIVGKNFKGYSVLELAEGNGYRWLRDSFHVAIDKLFEMAEHIILIGHIRDKNLANGPGAVNTIAKDLDLTGKVRNIACARADAIGFVYRDPTSHQLCANFKTIDGVNCGSRAKHLRGIEVKPFDWKKIFTQLN